MSSKGFLILAVAVAVLVCYSNAQGTLDRLGTIDGIPCSQLDILNMMGKCMIKFSRGHGVALFTKMRKSRTCDTSVISCDAVLETRLCLARLTPAELSPAYRPFINQVSDYQFGVFNIPCRVADLKAKCMDFFQKRGHTQF